MLTPRRYKNKPAKECLQRIVQYSQSMARYGKSPYIYPMYGLGELPQAFSRLSAVYGGTYMLDKPVDEVLFTPEGKFAGVRSGEETVKAKLAIGDPSYFGAGEMKEGQKMRAVEEGKVVRAICVLKHPIPGTEDVDSLQIIIPQNQVGRKNGACPFPLSRPHKATVLIVPPRSDIYIALLSHAQGVAAQGVYVAIVSTVVETSVPERELQPGLALLGPIHDKFVSVSPLYTPTTTGVEDNVYVTRSYDATSHLETVVQDVRDVWKRVTGEELKLTKKEVEVQE
jgi:Rab GDP dissociation inhibitor